MLLLSLVICSWRIEESFIHTLREESLCEVKSSLPMTRQLEENSHLRNGGWKAGAAKRQPAPVPPLQAWTFDSSSESGQKNPVESRGDWHHRSPRLAESLTFGAMRTRLLLRIDSEPLREAPWAMG